MPYLGTLYGASIKLGSLRRRFFSTAYKNSGKHVQILSISLHFFLHTLAQELVMTGGASGDEGLCYAAIYVAGVDYIIHNIKVAQLYK